MDEKSVGDEFKSLLDTYHLLLTKCVAALAPGKSQEERNTVRTVLEGYLAKSKEK
jgi:hypothetical protein